VSDEGRESAIPEPSPELIAHLAAAAGLTIDTERAASLVAQASEYFGILRLLVESDVRGHEIASEFRLDRAWEQR
jgi:hypothetical protein